MDCPLKNNFFCGFLLSRSIQKVIKGALLSTNNGDYDNYVVNLLHQLHVYSSIWKYLKIKHDHSVRLKRGFYLKYISRRQPFEFKEENFHPKIILVIKIYILHLPIRRYFWYLRIILQKNLFLITRKIFFFTFFICSLKRKRKI